MKNENASTGCEARSIFLLEEALIEYVERYGLTEKARSALVLLAQDKGKSSSHEIS